MAEESTLRVAIEFLDEIGVYDVILPFLLVFSIVFAILEKTKVFGTEVIEGVHYTRKNINAMVAFVVALLVVGSAELVDIVTEVSATTVILLMLSVLFLLLVGSFYREDKGVFLTNGWKTFFMWIMFIGIVIIFANAILDFDELFNGGSSILDGISSEVISAVVMLIILIFFVWLVVQDTPQKQHEKRQENK